MTMIYITKLFQIYKLIYFYIGQLSFALSQPTFNSVKPSMTLLLKEYIYTLQYLVFF